MSDQVRSRRSTTRSVLSVIVLAPALTEHRRVFDGEPIFFRGPHEFRDCLERHHATATECVVGYWKTHTGKPSLRWADAVREALCFGWIDGQGRSIDDERPPPRPNCRSGAPHDADQ